LYRNIGAFLINYRRSVELFCNFKTYLSAFPLTSATDENGTLTMSTLPLSYDNSFYLAIIAMTLSTVTTAAVQSRFLAVVYTHQEGVNKNPHPD
jgi:hypothetical protein